MSATAYITGADLLDYLSERELAQVAGRAGVTPADIEANLRLELEGTDTADTDAQGAAADINAAVSGANSLVDGYLAGRYSLPLDTVPEALKVQAVRIARYELHDTHPPDTVVDRHREAVRYLERVASGSIVLVSDQESLSNTAGRPSYSAPDRVFTSDDRSDFTGGDW